MQSQLYIPQIYDKDFVKLRIAGILSRYTEHTGVGEIKATLTGVMNTFLQLTGTATLLIGLHALTPTRACAINLPSLLTNNPYNNFSLTKADGSVSSYKIAFRGGDKVALKHSQGTANNDYEPPDNSGPGTSQGSGTR